MCCAQYIITLLLPRMLKYKRHKVQLKLKRSVHSFMRSSALGVAGVCGGQSKEGGGEEGGGGVNGVGSW